MPEFDELRLHINLDDQASAGLARLRNEIGSLGGGNAGRGFDQTRAQVRSITMLTRTLESGSLSARNAMNLLGLSFGGTAVAAGGLAYGFVTQARNLKEFSDKIIELGNRSRAVGAEGAEIANIVKQLQRMGIAEAEASRFATTYVQKIGELSDVNSELRTALQNRAGDYALDMRDYINRQIGAVGRGDIASAMNEHMRGAHNMVREKLNDPTNRGGTVSAAFELNENAKIWGLDVGTLAQITGDLRSSTVEQRAIWERQKIAAEAFAASYREVVSNFDEFNKGMMSSMVGAFDEMGLKFDTSIIDAHRWGRTVGDAVGRGLEELTKFIDDVVDVLEWFQKFQTEPRGAITEAQQGLFNIRNIISVRRTGGGGGTPSQGLQFFQEGGIVTRPTVAMIGEAGPEAVVPLAGGSDLASNMGFVKRALEWSGAMEPLKEALPTLTPAAASEIMSWAHAVDVPGAGLLSIAFDLFGLGVDVGQRGASKAFSQREMSKYAPAAGPVLTALELTQAGLSRETVQQQIKEYVLKVFPDTPPENAQVFVDKIVEFSTAETKGAAPRGFFSGFFRPGSARLSRQYGGPVSAGQSYLVGERGPETFMPGSSERDLQQSISERRDNTYAFAATERPGSNLRDEVRRLNDWYRQRKGERPVGATDTGAMPSSVGGGDGYGVSGDFGGGNQFGIGGEGNAPPGGIPGGAPSIGGGGAMGGGGAGGAWEPAAGPPSETGGGGDRPGISLGTGELTPNKYDPRNRRIAASVRNANVGASWPAAHDYKYGGKVGVLYDPKNRIAQFSTVEGGMASNMELLLTSKHYKGKTIRQAIYTWSGRHRSTVFGDARDNQIIHPGLLDDPEFRRQWFHIKAKAEAGKSWITDAQIDTAYEIYKVGGLDKWQAQRASARPVESSDRDRGTTEGRPPTDDSASVLQTDNRPPSEQPSTGGGGVTAAPLPSGQSNVGSGRAAGGGRVSELQPKVAGVRRLPLSPSTRMQLDYAAAQTGLQVEVFSGGQAKLGTRGPRTGSTRHDLGGAADFKLRDPKTGKILDSGNPADVPRMSAFVTAAVQAGATGVGSNYMGSGAHRREAIHVGGGRPAAWGGGSWSRSAWREGMDNPVSKERVASILRSADEADRKELAQANASANDDRSEIDASMGKQATARTDADLTVKAKVTAPGGTTVVAKSDGAIKKTEVEREKPSVATEAKNEAKTEAKSEQKEAA